MMEIDGKIMQRHVPRGLWDVDWRLRDMDTNDVDVQLLSPTTQTFFYEAEPALGAACAALQNDQIAKDGRAPSQPFHRASRRCRCRRPSGRPTSSSAP